MVQKEVITPRKTYALKALYVPTISLEQKEAKYITKTYITLVRFIETVKFIHQK